MSVCVSVSVVLQLSELPGARPRIFLLRTVNCAITQTKTLVETLRYHIPACAFVYLYLTFTFTIWGGVLPPYAEASSGPNAQPHT